jgi:hypothetical protein
MNRKFVIERLEIDFDNFIHQLHIPNFIENRLEQFALDLRSHSIRAVDADQAGVKRNVDKLSTGPRIVQGTAKIRRGVSDARLNLKSEPGTSGAAPVE